MKSPMVLTIKVGDQALSGLLMTFPCLYLFLKDVNLTKMAIIAIGGVQRRNINSRRKSSV